MRAFRIATQVPASRITTVPHFGINRRELDVLLREIGGRVEHLRRTGEVAYFHPLMSDRPKADGRRKDAPAQLVRFVRRAIERIHLPAMSATHAWACIRPQ